MSTKSRRHMKLAAGAILAGAAIPIAAAGAAWADDTAAPVDKTETQAQLEAQGLSSAQAQAVVNAENGTTPVEVSYDGKIVVEANEGGTASTDATASSGRHDAVSAAIGGGTDSTAHGRDALAFDEGASTDSSDAAKAHGAHATAEVSGSIGATVTADGKVASAEDVGSTDSTSSARGTGAEAVNYSDTDTTASARGTGAEASGEFTTDSTATSRGTRADAALVYTDDSTATAKGTASGAAIEGTSTSVVSDSSNLTNNGGTYTLTTSDTNWVNGAPTMDPAADVSAALHVPLP